MELLGVFPDFGKIEQELTRRAKQWRDAIVERGRGRQVRHHPGLR